MPIIDLSQQEADEVVAEPKIISGNIQWQRDGRGYRLKEVVVLATESDRILRLRGWVGSHNRSAVLLYRNYPIRKWTFHARHRLPDGTVIEGPHKHTWDDNWHDDMAYIPDDIRVGDPVEELQDFLTECNITLLGTISQDVRQLDLRL